MTKIKYDWSQAIAQWAVDLPQRGVMRFRSQKTVCVSLTFSAPLLDESC